MGVNEDPHGHGDTFDLTMDPRLQPTAYDQPEKGGQKMDDAMAAEMTRNNVAWGGDEFRSKSSLIGDKRVGGGESGSSLEMAAMLNE